MRAGGEQRLLFKEKQNPLKRLYLNWRVEFTQRWPIACSVAPIGCLWSACWRRTSTSSRRAVGTRTRGSIFCAPSSSNAPPASTTTSRTYGPRYIGAALPFFFLGLAQVWTRGARLVRWLVGLLVLAGAVVTSMAVSTLVMIPEDVGAPLTEVIVPSFLRADLAQNRQSFFQYGDANPAYGVAGAWNLGQLVGLPGLWSLLPLFILWGSVCTSL
jgi:hypothetical protein